MDGSCRLPLRTVPLALVTGLELLSYEFLANLVAVADFLVLNEYKTPP
jgi:hypothetical protein